DQPAKGVPSLAGKLDTPELRQAVLDRLNRDIDYGERLGAPQREDIQNARRIISESGLVGLRAALKAGKIALPAIAAVLGTDLMSQLMGGGEAKAAEQPKPTIRDHIVGALKKQGVE